MADAAPPPHEARLAALAARAAAYDGAVRARLDARLQALREAADAAKPAAASIAPEPPARAPSQAPAPALTTPALPSPLTALLAHAAQQAGRAEAPVPDGAPLPGTPAAAHAEAPAAELKALRWFGDTWTRLRIEQRLSQSLATVPENAGPLNTARLLHQTLAAVHEASPAYLHRFVGYVDTLLWLEGATSAAAGAAVEPIERPRSDGRRSTRRAR